MLLQYFTRPAILKAIGDRRLALLLKPFAQDLLASKLAVAGPDPPDDAYFSSLAALFTNASLLPDRLRSTLLAIERVVAPDNLGALEAAITRHIPNVSIPTDCPLIDRALELWFHYPDKLLALLPPDPTVQGSKFDVQGSTFTSTPSALPPSDAPTPQPPPSPVPTTLALLLDVLVATLKRFVVLPQWAAETLALFIVHTFAWELRDVTTYLAIESPTHRCGKSTLLAVLAKLVHEPEVAAHISSPAFFHTIHETHPTLLVDETDKVLKKNHLLCGILNASYLKDLAYVVRVVPRSKKQRPKDNNSTAEYIPLSDSDVPSAPAPRPSSDVARYCCWCPKVMAQIGHFPETLADRCISILMQRKTPAEKCERVRKLKGEDLRKQCAEWVRDHREAIANAEPDIPEALNDRAADIWSPLLVLADLAGGDWPQKARQAAIGLSGGSEQGTNVLSGLLLDCLGIFAESKAERMFTRDLVKALNALANRPWHGLSRGKPVNEYWLARQLRPFGIQPQTLWIESQVAKGYVQETFVEPARRYVSKADWEAYLARNS